MKLPTLPPEPPGPSVVQPAAFGALGGVHLRIADLDRALRFWGGLIGLPIVRSEPAPARCYFLALGAGVLVLEEVPAPAADAPTPVGPQQVSTVDLSVSDLDALEGVRRRLLEGGVPVSGLQDLGWAYAFRFRCPASGVVFRALAVVRSFEPDERFGDDARPAAAVVLLGPRPA